VRADFEEIIHVMRSWGRSYVKWSLALDQNLGPHDGGCGTCTPLVTINSTSGALTYDVEFYTLGHFSKFVLPGAYRIYSGNAAGVISAAFLNPDGSKALVAYNDTSSSKTFQVRWGNQSFAYTLASLAGATFTWTGVQSGGYTVDATSQIQASSFNAIFGLETETTTDTLGGYDLGYANDGDYAVYQNVNFGSGVTNVSARVASAGSGGTLEFRLDNSNGPLISSVALPITGGWQTWQTVSGSVSGASGLHNLYVVFKGGSGVGNLNWFQFGGVLPTPSFVGWQLQYFGCTNCPQALANADPLGKGISNTNQFLLGLNPINPASTFKVISIAPQGPNVVITWKTAGVRTNVVQASSGGSYATNEFADISGPMIINVTGDTTTNYTDVGGATNVPSRFYRVRLGP